MRIPTPKCAKPGRFIGMLLLLIFSLPNASKNEFLYRVLWDQGSIMRKPDFFMQQIRNAAKFGYNTVLSTDHDLSTIEEQPPKFFTKYEQAKSTAKKHGIELLIWHFWQGHPAAENFNLAESFPVQGTKFVVKNSEARAVGDHDIGLKNGDFESFVGNKPDNWGPSRLSEHFLIDKTCKKSGEVSLCVKNAPAYSVIRQNIKVKPFRAYEISAWFKTKALKDYQAVRFAVDPHLLARTERPFGTPYMKVDGKIKGVWTRLSPTMNWTQCKADFNSLEQTQATLSLWFAYKGEQEGDIWVDDLQIREVGLYETIRHQDKPIIVKSADGGNTYEEGTDYVVDPKCNSMTVETYWYEGHLRIPQGSAIQEGQQLRVDWSQFGNVRIVAAPSDFCLPETWEALQDNLERIDKLLGKPVPFHTHVSEWRMGGWNPNCRSFQFKDGGQYMARMWEGIECMIRKKDNGCRTIFTESDMFDPFHNGRNRAYATWFGEGTYGSFEGLSHDAIVLNWNVYRNRKYTDSSLCFFGGLDPKYPNVKTRQVLNVLDAGQAAACCNDLDRLEKKGLEGVVGVYYTTWWGDWSHTGPVANAFKARGRWPNNPFPHKTCAPIDRCKGFDKDKVGIGNPGSESQIASATQLKIVPGQGRNIEIEYRVSQYKPVSLNVYDLQGRKIRQLVNTTSEIGKHRIAWNTSAIPAGVYFLSLSLGGTQRTTLRYMIM